MTIGTVLFQLLRHGRYGRPDELCGLMQTAEFQYLVRVGTSAFVRVIIHEIHCSARKEQSRHLDADDKMKRPRIPIVVRRDKLLIFIQHRGYRVKIVIPDCPEKGLYVRIIAAETTHSVHLPLNILVFFAIKSGII